MDITASSSYNFQALIQDCINKVNHEALKHKVKISSFVEPITPIKLLKDNESFKNLMIDLLKRCILSLNEGDLLLLIEDTNQDPQFHNIIFTLRGVGQINESVFQEQIVLITKSSSLILDNDYTDDTHFHIERENNHGFVVWFSIT